MAETYTYRCELDRVIDGDTVVVSIDLGFRLTAKLPIRLVGVNAPELSTAAGRASRDWTINWFAGQAHLMIVTLKDPEKYGRWLGTISPLPEGTSLNDALVAAQQAVPWDGRGPRPS